MLDEKLRKLRAVPPEKRARRQLAALSATTRNTIKALAKHPDDHRTADILHRHDQHVAKILQWGREPPISRCRICGMPLRQEPEVWTSDPALKCLWACVVTAVFLIVFAFFDWWALWVFPIAWLISLSFFWAITIPALLLLNVFLGATGIRF